ncbi:hypothetical protein EDD86DRAFT_212400 [Gorgonomyces haynaldii]|nr:hypothetical protein EDD86DRAFT_212400 [Gorgonomyces haynaldii]
MLGSQWFQDFSCQGPPDSVFSFNVSDLTVEYPPDNEMWSLSYFLQSPYSNCGFLSTQAVKRIKGCCEKSLDTTYTFNYASFTNLIVSSPESIAEIPTGAVGTSYCYLYKPQDQYSLFGFNSILIRDNGVCVDGQLKCSNGTFYYYDYDSDSPYDPGCTSLLDWADLTKDEQLIESVGFGTSYGRVLKVEAATGVTDYLAEYPLQYLVPTFKYPIEVLSIMAMVLSIILSLFLPIEVALQAWHRRRVSIWQIGHTVAFLMMLVVGILRIYTWVYYIDYSQQSRDTYAVVLQVDNLFMGWMLLWSMLFCANSIIVPMLLIDSPEWTKYIAYIVPVFYHLIFWGNTYLFYYTYWVMYYTPEHHNWLSNFGREWNTWQGSFMLLSRFIWISWTVFPPFLVVYGIFKRRRAMSLGEIFHKLRSANKWFAWYFSGFVLICVVYMILAGLNAFPEVLRSDRMVYSFPAFGYLFLCLAMLFLVRSISVITTAIQTSQDPSTTHTTDKVPLPRLKKQHLSLADTIKDIQNAKTMQSGPLTPGSISPGESLE